MKEENGQTLTAGAFVLLFRCKISLMVAASGAFGFFLASGGVSAAMFWTAAGCFLLASGCSAWNQVQERDIDVLMPRTACRPVACALLDAGEGVMLGAVAASAGIFCFVLTGNSLVVLLSLGVILLYNGVYTPLKRVSSLALLPGAAVGAFPLLMGWAAAGEPMNDPKIMLLYGLCLMWQIPHFWTRVQNYYVEYAAAGLPMTAIVMTPERYRRIMGLWVLAFACCIVMLAIFPVLGHPTLRLGLAALAFPPIFSAVLCLRRKSSGIPYKISFRLVDGCMLAVLLLGVADKLL